MAFLKRITTLQALAQTQNTASSVMKKHCTCGVFSSALLQHKIFTADLVHSYCFSDKTQWRITGRM
ncbi:MAG TPA: hypothetical protein DF774_06915 [Rheinheimera sp.]|nr:hypothetical protein [Rheinheimera sp.]